MSAAPDTKSRVSVMQNQLSPFPYEVKGYIYDPVFLAPPSAERAKRAHENHPDLQEHLDKLTEINKTVYFEHERKEGKVHGARAFQGQFFNSILNFEDFVDVTDAALLHIQKDEIYNHPGSDSKEYLIAGGGPTGALSAIEAVLHGHSATIIEAYSTAIRARLIGIYPEDVLKLARLGAPIEIFYDMFAWCEKDAAIISDIENFVLAIAVKLGVKLYRNSLAVPTDLMKQGKCLIQYKEPPKFAHLPKTGAIDQSAMICFVQGNQQKIDKKSIEVPFDTFIDSTGSRRVFVPLLTGKDRDECVEYLHILAAEQLDVTKDKELYQWDPDEEHIKHVLDNVDWAKFVDTMEKAKTDGSLVPQIRTVTAFTSNMPRNLFRTDTPVPNTAFGNAPPDWVCIPMPYARRLDDKVKSMEEKQSWGKIKVDKMISLDEEKECDGSEKVEVPKKEPANVKNRMSYRQSNRISLNALKSLEGQLKKTSGRQSMLWGKPVSMAEHFGLYGGDADIERVQFEGMCPVVMTNSKGEKFDTKAFIGEVNKKYSGDLLWAFLECIIGTSGLDREAYEDYIKKESTFNLTVQNTTAGFSGNPKGLRTDPTGETITSHGIIPGSDKKEYYILGDCQGDPWFRWGIGVHDACYSVRILSACMSAEARGDEESINRYMRDLELRSRCRHVHTSFYYWDIGLKLETHPQMIDACTIIQDRTGCETGAL